MINRRELPDQPSALRQVIRSGDWAAPTAGLAQGFVQANLVIVPSSEAEGFRQFCEINPKPCPLLEMTTPGSPVPTRLAPDADLRTDVPKYCIYQHGEVQAELTDLTEHWQDDLVCFLLGCSFTFERALQAGGVPVHHIDADRNVPMYRTNIPCRPAGHFTGPLVVSMRAIAPELVERAAEITSHYPRMHGAPVHVDDPEAIGISDLLSPDYGDEPIILAGEVPVFWACGVTPQAVAVASGIELVITHAPGHMFITDVRDEEFYEP
jgi:uncharacterized protein YcsI (UPF0317 family)